MEERIRGFRTWLFIEVSNSLNELISSLRLQNSKVKNVYMNYRPAEGRGKVEYSGMASVWFGISKSLQNLEEYVDIDYDRW